MSYGNLRENITTELVSNIVEREINLIQETKELEFERNDKEQLKLCNKSDELYKKLEDALTGEEDKQLLDSYYGACISEWTNLCRFYFREGLKAGLTDLKYLKEHGLYTLIK